MAPPQPSGASCLKPNEKEYEPVLNRLSERFPTVPGHRVAQALRDHKWHAGEAAAVLRDLTSCNVKEADADDIEHVSTLLSSPAMFKHACKEQFRKYDVNKDGVLEWEEVKELVGSLYEEFGLQLPSEGSLKAFFFATDENMDGVLSEREFRKFFEMFLRYAFFDHLKLRQMVEKGQEIEQRRISMGAVPGQRISQARPPQDTDVSPQDSRASSASEVSKPTKRPTPDETPQVQSKPEPVRLAPIEQQKEDRRSKRESEQGQNESRNHRDRDRDRDRDHRSGRQDKERERAPPPEASEGAFGTALRCLASNGVAYRNSPAFQDRTDTVVPRGETVRVLEHWIRTPDGWLPVMDAQSQPLFERSSAEPSGSHDNQKKRVSIQEIRDDTLDVNVRSANAAAATQKPSRDVSSPKAPKAESRRPEAESSRGSLDIQEEWRPVFETLKKRFVNISPEKIAQALRDNEGHAGKAASMLRYM